MYICTYLCTYVWYKCTDGWGVSLEALRVKGQAANWRSWNLSAAYLALQYDVSAVSKGWGRCHAAENDPVFCSETATKSEPERWSLNSSRDSLKFNLVTSFTAHFFGTLVLVLRKRRRISGGRDAMVCLRLRHCPLKNVSFNFLYQTTGLRLVVAFLPFDFRLSFYFNVAFACYWQKYSSQMRHVVTNSIGIKFLSMCVRAFPSTKMSSNRIHALCIQMNS